MGRCAEKTARDLEIGREAQDAFCIESYKRATQAWRSGVMNWEIEPVRIRGKEAVAQDEDFMKLRLEKVSALKPAFEEGGTITPANGSNLNDVAAAVVLMSAERAMQMGIAPLARVLSWADHACPALDVGIASSGAVKKALKRAKLRLADFYRLMRRSAPWRLRTCNYCSSTPRASTSSAAPWR